MEITITIKFDEEEMAKVKSEKSEMEIDAHSCYARFYDESCEGWTNNPEYNYLFLKTMQQWANDMLKYRGHLFLNEVYKALGMTQTKAGQVVGWVYDPNNPVTDSFVDFGLSTNRKKAIKGCEKAILLDFNVDGVILDKVL